MSSRRIQELLPKMEHFDADERFMATNDLMAELKKLEKLEQNLQVPIRKAILKQLEDGSANVSTIAVRALEDIVQKFNQDQIIVIVDTLGELLVDPKKGSVRDIYSEALKKVLSVCDPATGNKTTPKLLKNIQRGLNLRLPDDEEAKAELASMTVLTDLLKYFGGECQDALGPILQSLLKLLEHTYESARLEAAHTLGPLTPYLTPSGFESLMNRLISQIKASDDPGVYIQCVVTISKHAALRVAHYLERLVPILLGFCEQESEDVDTNTILWSSCLEAFNSLIHRCPNKISPYIEKIITLSRSKLKYDPNFVDDSKMDVDGDEDEDDNEGWGDDDDDDGGWGDDDGADGGGDWGGDDEIPDASADESWKIRKSAIRVISTFIIARSDILKGYADFLADDLIARFNERDSSVQEQVYHAFRELLHEATDGASSQDMPEIGSMMVPTLMRQRSFLDTLVDKIPSAIERLSAVFPSAKVAAQKAMFSVLSEMTVIHEGQMGAHFPSIMPHINKGLTATGTAAVLNEDAIHLTRLLFKYHDFEALQEYIPDLAISSAKVVEQATIIVKPKGLLLCGMIAASCPAQKDFIHVKKDLFNITYSQLEQKAINESIKNASIDAMALIMSSQGAFSVIGPQSLDTLQLIKARLGNSVTQISALQAITKIANSGVQYDLTPLVNSSIPELSSFLRQVSARLKHEAMICLEALVRSQALRRVKISAKDYATILVEVVPHIGETDLQLAGLGLNLVSSILEASPGVAPKIAKDVLPKTFEFVRCPLLHGTALKSLIRFFQYCIKFGGKEKSLTFQKVLQSLLGCITKDLERPGYSSIAQCIAGITCQTGDKLRTSTVKKFMSDFSGKSSHTNTKVIALLSIGEIGHEIDLSSLSSIFTDILSAFDSKEIYVREAAFFALGNVTVGCMDKFLRNLLDMISSDAAHEYLLLSSLKENIISHQDKIEIFTPYVEVVMPLLCERAEAKDEGVRKVAAECLGWLGVISSHVVVPKLVEISKSDSPHVRAVAATALRLSLQGSKTGSGIGIEIESCIDDFLCMLKDSDIDVRREAVLTARSFCLSKHVSICRLKLGQILPCLYSETKAHPELVHEMDYGNFKVTIDDGLSLRKAVYQTLDSIMDSLSRLVDMQEFNDQMKVGLADGDYDVQIMTYRSYQKLARAHPGVLLEMLDEFPSLIMSPIKGHLKVAKSKEPLRAKECLRVIVSVMLTFNTVKGVELCNKYQVFFRKVCKTKLLQEILKELEA